METILRAWGFALCTAALAAALLSAAAPDGPLARSLKYVLGLYIVLVAVSPLLGMRDLLCDGIPPLEGFSAEASLEAYDDAVLAQSTRLIEQSLADDFAREGIDASAEIFISMGEDGGIYCDRVVLRAGGQDAQRAAELVRAQLGTQPEIITGR